MNTEDVLDEFRAAGALREGHFVLSSGLHSPVFLQKNLVFMYPDRSERLCRALAEKIRGAASASSTWSSRRPSAASSPATRPPASWACPRIYVEREGGEFKLRRGFAHRARARGS